MAVHSNIRGGQHGYIWLVVRPTAYSLLTNIPFVSQAHPGNLSIPIAALLHTQEELKLQYDENLQVLNKTRGVERELIQKLVLSVEEKCIIATRNSTTGQFTGTLFMLIPYLIVTYGELSLCQLIDLEHNTK